MAMAIPKAGYARFLKEGAQHFKGLEEAVYHNIEVCSQLVDQIRSAYGPGGMNKMVINRIEKLFVTKNTTTILKELEVQHPAARMIIMASQMQEKQIGDGTNAVAILAAALLNEAANLLRAGVSVAEIESGYRMALKRALEILPNFVVEKAKNLFDVRDVKKYIMPSIVPKQYDNADLISSLVADACVRVAPVQAVDFSVDSIRVCKILGSGVHASHVLKGMVFRRPTEGEVKKVESARVAIFACPFDLTQTETKGTVLVETAKDLLNFSAGEEREVESQVEALANIGVNVVVAAGSFGDLYMHFLNKYGIMGVRLTSKFDMRRLCRTLGAQAQSRIFAPAVNHLGACKAVFEDEIGDTSVVVFDDGREKGAVSTIVVRGSSDSLMDDVERAIDDGVNTYKALTKDSRLLAGGGAVEIELSRAIESFGDRCPGLEQYAITAFARALDALPKQLGQNAGFQASEVLTSLHAAHEAGNPNAGIDVENGGVNDAVEKNIFDLFSGKQLALKLATDAAVTILKVDQIIMAKQATGGPAARAPKGQDEGDEPEMA